MNVASLILLGAALLSPSEAVTPPAPPSSISSVDEALFYFERDSLKIRPGSDPVWRMIEHYVTKSPPAWVRVNAHSDSAGSPDANMALSVRRGEVIARRVAEMGVDPAIIVIHACGEFRLAVGTGDGVDEPLNRRVTVEWGEGQLALKADEPCKVFPYRPKR